MKVEQFERDDMGRPETIRVTIPRSLPAPVPLYPFEWFTRGGIPEPNQPGYNPNFQWAAIGGAETPTVAFYDLELRQPPGDSSPADCDSRPALARISVAAPSLQIPFSSLQVQLSNRTAYCFRVRGRTAAGEIGPFSPWVMFKIGGRGRYRIATSPISPRTRFILMNCIRRRELRIARFAVAITTLRRYRQVCVIRPNRSSGNTQRDFRNRAFL